MSLALNAPDLVPVAVGLKTTLIEHFDLAARLVVQVVEETLKSPLAEITMLPSATLRLLVSVNTLATLEVPTVCEANVAPAGVNVAGSAPVPESETVCGLLEALSVMVNFPVRVPS